MWNSVWGSSCHLFAPDSPSLAFPSLPRFNLSILAPQSTVGLLSSPWSWSIQSYLSPIITCWKSIFEGLPPPRNLPLSLPPHILVHLVWTSMATITSLPFKYGDFWAMPPLPLVTSLSGKDSECLQPACSYGLHESLLNWLRIAFACHVLRIRDNSAMFHNYALNMCDFLACRNLLNYTCKLSHLRLCGIRMCMLKYKVYGHVIWCSENLP